MSFEQTFKPAFEVQPDELIMRKRPESVGGGFVPDRVRKIGLSAAFPTMIMIVGDGWKWSVPIRAEVEVLQR